MAEHFGLSQAAMNHWIHLLLPVVQAALAELDPAHFAHTPPQRGSIPGVSLTGQTGNASGRQTRKNRPFHWQEEDAYRQERGCRRRATKVILSLFQVFPVRSLYHFRCWL